MLYYKKHKNNTLTSLVILLAIIVVLLGVFVVSKGKKSEDENAQAFQTETQQVVLAETETETEEEEPLFTAKETDDTVVVGEEIESGYAIVIDEGDGTIVAEKNAFEKMYPASMTKVLTVLTAADGLETADLDELVTVTIEATDYSFVNDCSTTGFLDGEQVTLRDLFYGTILPSGGESAYQLALYKAGTMDAFVEMMNQKCEELGISQTSHFANPVGIYDDNNYTTAYDMAIIMEAAMQNDICREALSAHTYKTSVTEQHPDGITISNRFLRRIEDHYFDGIVVGAKTGYVNQSGNCAVSYATASNGKNYICVTGGATSGWNCIYNHVDLYTAYATDAQLDIAQ